MSLIIVANALLNIRSLNIPNITVQNIQMNGSIYIASSAVYIVEKENKYEIRQQFSLNSWNWNVNSDDGWQG